MAATTSIPGLRFIRGRTEKTRNAVYGGYRYGSPSQLKTGKTSWSCIRKDCNGRIYTIGDTHVEARKEHNQERIFNATKQYDSMDLMDYLDFMMEL